MLCSYATLTDPVVKAGGLAGLSKLDDRRRHHRDILPSMDRATVFVGTNSRSRQNYLILYNPCVVILAKFAPEVNIKMLKLFVTVQACHSSVASEGVVGSDELLAVVRT